MRSPRRKRRGLFFVQAGHAPIARGIFDVCKIRRPSLFVPPGHQHRGPGARRRAACALRRDLTAPGRGCLPPRLARRARRLPEHAGRRHETVCRSARRK